MCSVHLQVDTANGQTTNFHLHNEQMVNGVRKIAWASFFHLIFCCKTSEFPNILIPCPHVYVSVSMSMSPCLHVPMSPCPYVYMCLCSHVSMCPYAHMSICPCLQVSMYPCPHLCFHVLVHVSMSSSGLRSRNWTEPYSFGDSGTGTVFGIRFRFRVQGN